MTVALLWNRICQPQSFILLFKRNATVTSPNPREIFPANKVLRKKRRCAVSGDFAVCGLAHAETTFYPCPGSGAHESAFVALQCEVRNDVTNLKDDSRLRQSGLIPVTSTGPGFTSSFSQS